MKHPTPLQLARGGFTKPSTSSNAGFHDSRIIRKARKKA
jgi:hypothetical protein